MVHYIYDVPCILAYGFGYVISPFTLKNTCKTIPCCPRLLLHGCTPTKRAPRTGLLGKTQCSCFTRWSFGVSKGENSWQWQVGAMRIHDTTKWDTMEPLLFGLRNNYCTLHRLQIKPAYETKGVFLYLTFVSKTQLGQWELPKVCRSSVSFNVCAKALEKGSQWQMAIGLLIAMVC